MNELKDHYTRLAALFCYPDAEFAARVREVQAFLDETCPDASKELKEFTEFASQASLVELEELYTRSFDVQAAATLDLGYVLFGDDYKRGALLVNLSGEHREAGVDCGHELPDHLPNVLQLLDAIRKPRLREELVQRIVAPALRRIIEEFDPDKLEKKNKTYIRQYKTLIERSERYAVVYRKPLQALYTVLERDFDVGEDQKPAAVQPSRFLHSIGTELKLECNKGKCHGAPE
jgi:nitrate reductase molybdenum cofactor assembly chaperone